jgi:hypothetical protein
MNRVTEARFDEHRRECPDAGRARSGPNRPSPTHPTLPPTPSSGGRTWWAHFEFTRISIEPIILRKKIEDLREAGAYAGHVPAIQYTPTQHCSTKNVFESAHYTGFLIRSFEPVKRSIERGRHKTDPAPLFDSDLSGRFSRCTNGWTSHRRRTDALQERRPTSQIRATPG